MPSSFTWLDYSEHDRRKAMDVIDMFRERDTRDELGIGSVRDALSDLLFPGTSTIQSRVKYFLYIPWAYKNVESWARSKRRSRIEIENRARQLENQIRDALVDNHQHGGVFGSEAGHKLKRLPSSVYWAGLGKWGIRLFAGSLRQLHSSLRFPVAFAEAVAGDEKELERSGYWRPGLPEQPSGFPANETLDLTSEQAVYLRERIQHNIPTSLLAWLVDHAENVDGVDAPWAHPCVGDLPAKLAADLEHARNFAEVIHGSALLYNLMLAEMSERAGRITEYRDCMERWAQEREADQHRLNKWDREAFWDTVHSVNPRVPQTTRRFVNQWLDLALVEPGASGIADSKAARILISDREWWLKQNRARLHDRRALEMWSGAAGVRLNTFRWAVVSDIVNDIRNGLDGKGGADA